MTKLAPLLLLLLATAAQAENDQRCHYEKIILFVSERPKPQATIVRPPLVLVGPPVQKVKGKRVKKMPPRDGFRWVCDDDPITEAPPERIAVIAVPEPIALDEPALALVAPAAPLSFEPPADPGYAYGPPLYPYAPPWIIPGGPCCFVLPPVIVPAVPEASTYWMLIVGILAIVVLRRRS